MGRVSNRSPYGGCSHRTRYTFRKEGATVVIQKASLALTYRTTCMDIRDGNEPCYVPQHGEAPIEECDPFVYSVGEPLHLPCHNFNHSFHLPEGANNVEWFKDGVLLGTYKEINLTKDSLQISDSGGYMCRIGNQYNFSHKILVGRKPPKELRTPDCTSYYIGTYTCSWFADEMNRTNLPTRSQLQFLEFDSEEYEYFNVSSYGDPLTVKVNSTMARYVVSTCVANCLGQSLSSTQKVSPSMTYVPPPIRHVRLVPTSTDQLNVSFDPPLLWEDKIVEYSYQFIQERTSFAVWDNAMVGDTTTNVFLLDVADGKPFSEVCIRVAAYSQHTGPMKISEYSTPVCNYTQMAAPSVGPHHFTFSSAPEDRRPELRKVNFTWEHLKPDEANGIILKYILILSVTSTENNTTKQIYNISAKDFFLLAEGIQSHCEYRAELYAENAVGKSPPSVNTILMASEGEVFSLTLLILALLLSSGFLFAGLRLFFSVKKRVLPKVPEPILKSQLFRMKIEVSPFVEKEVFDELHFPQEGSSSNTVPPTEDKSGYIQDKTLTQGLLENKVDPYVKIDSPSRTVIATNVGGYVTWK